MSAQKVICAYCQQPARFLPSSEMLYHGRDFGPAYFCKADDAWVGCHPGTGKPLGRLANKELRQAKMAAHSAFDPIWKAIFQRKHAADPTYKKHHARGGRYKALALALGIKSTECHIGMFDVATCRRVVEICKAGLI